MEDLERPLGHWASLVAQLVKNPPAIQETPVQFLGQGDPLEKKQAIHSVFYGFPGSSIGKESAFKWKTWDRSLGWEDSLEEGMVTHSCILVWRIPTDRVLGELQSMGSKSVGHD